MTLFSQRKGLKPVKSGIQVDSMDDDLRNGLWSALSIFYWELVEKGSISRYEGDVSLSGCPSIALLFRRLHLHYFKKPIDTLGDSWIHTYSEIRGSFFRWKWYEVYDFIEFIANNYDDEHDSANNSINLKFMQFCNSILERELSAYRFVGGNIVQITSKEEIAEIEEALEVSEPLKPITIHLQRASNLLADRKSPDYRNSIKESISAVEAICKLITNNDKAKLGQALKEMEGKVELHPALKSAFNSLYGYTSDAEGIRHALLDQPQSKVIQDQNQIMI